MTRDLLKLFTALFMLEVVARIVGPKDHGPYLLSLTAGEPMTEFEERLYAAMEVPEDV